MQVILSHIEGVPRDQVEPEDFLPQSSQNVAKLTARLRELLFGLRDPHLRALAECFLIDEAFLSGSPPPRRGSRTTTPTRPACSNTSSR